MARFGRREFSRSSCDYRGQALADEMRIEHTRRVLGRIRAARRGHRRESKEAAN